MTVSAEFDRNTGTSFIEVRRDGKSTTMKYVGNHESISDRFSMNRPEEAKKIGSQVVKKYGSLAKKFSPGAFDNLVIQTVEKKLDKLEEKYDARVDAVFASYWGGVDLNGMNEEAMIQHWRKFDPNHPTGDFFKGSAFGWTGPGAKTSHSFAARLLAVGLPPALKGQVSIGVKTHWTAHDVQIYAETIHRKLGRS